MPAQIWWVWRSWLARQIVALEAKGSSPFIHPIFQANGHTVFSVRPFYIFSYTEVSPSGKAQDFDSCSRWFESIYLCQS